MLSRVGSGELRRFKCHLVASVSSSKVALERAVINCARVFSLKPSRPEKQGRIETLKSPRRISISIAWIATTVVLNGCGEAVKQGPDAGTDGGGSSGSNGSPHGGNGNTSGSGNAGGNGNSGQSGNPGGEDTSPDSGAEGGEPGDSGGPCAVNVEEHAVTMFSHVAECTPLTFESNPPSSGNHFLYWAALGVYEFPLPRGYWVHNLEHGTVVVSYNCPDGCADDVAAAKGWLTGLPIDETCTAQGVTIPRVILTPDPKLDVAWAASAWGFTLRANCFDSAAFSAFYDAHVDHGREATCLTGLEFRNEDGSRKDTLPADCGD
jgi:hypothetical protein